jgi:1-acyl-sn-glycerol-3-phosphate acyltransferase
MIALAHGTLCRELGSDMSRLHKPKAGWMVRAVVVVLYPFSGLMFRIRFSHLDRIPPTGGVILAANHISHVDTVLMARVVWQAGRIPRFMVKSTIFDSPMLGQIMRRSKQIPVSRGTADAAKSLDAAKAALDAHEAVFIYPEGTITKDPAQWPMQAKSGLARLVLLAPDVPVIPIGQWGSQQVKGGQGRRHLLRRRTAAASVGRPVDLVDLRQAEPTARTLVEVTNRIMTAIRDEVATLRGEDAPMRFYRPPGAGSKRSRKSMEPTD